MTRRTDVVVIGGQAGLAAGYHLRRLGIEPVILDAPTAPGGAVGPGLPTPPPADGHGRLPQ